MDTVAEVEAAPATMGVVRKVQAGSTARYDGGLVPEWTSITVWVAADDPEAYFAEIERRVSEAGIPGVRLTLAPWPRSAT